MLLFQFTIWEKENRMLEQFYTQTSVITQLRRGLLGAYLDDLATTLHEQGYAHASIRCSLRHCDQFGQWLDAQRYTVAEVDETLVEQYLNRFPRSRNGRRPKAAQGLPHLIRLLRHHDIIPPPNGRCSLTAIDQCCGSTSSTLNTSLGLQPAHARAISSSRGDFYGPVLGEPPS